MVNRYYSSLAVPAILTADVGATGNPSVSTITGWPTSYPFTVLLDFGVSLGGVLLEEAIEVTGAPTSNGDGTWTLPCNRGVDDTSARSHKAGAPAIHGMSERDLAESQAHIAATTNVHGIADTSVLGKHSVSVLNVVTDYGADPTGATDSTAALQNAANAGPGVMYFPPGTYQYTTFSVPTGISFDAAGPNAVTLDQRGAGITASAEWVNQSFKGFTLSTANLTTDQTNMFYATYGAGWCEFAFHGRVHTTHVTEAAVKLGTASDGASNNFRRIQLEPTGGASAACTGIFLAGTGVNSRVNATLFDHPVVNGFTNGVVVQACQGATFLRPSFNTCTTALTFSTVTGDIGTVFGHVIFGGYFDSSNGTQISLINANAGDVVPFVHVYDAIGITDATKIVCSGNGSATCKYFVRAMDGRVFGNEYKPSVALTDASTITVNAALGSYFRVTLTADGHTLGNPTNGADGQEITVEVIQPSANGPYTILYDTAYAFSTDLPQPTLSTGASKHDFLKFRYNSTAAKWYLLAKNFGF